MRRLVALVVMAAGTTQLGCGVDDASTNDGELSAQSAPTAGAPTWPSNCVVRLHGKGGSGEPLRVVDGMTEVSPSGNADGWGARQWLYASSGEYAAARALVTVALDDAGCSRAVVNGFSNGGSFAAALYCSGERFDDRVIGYIVDDPVPDEAVIDCTAPLDVGLALYWTGALESMATPGASCGALDWTCSGDSLIGVVQYADELGTTIKPSPYSEHEWHRDAPESAVWLSD